MMVYIRMFCVVYFLVIRPPTLGPLFIERQTVRHKLPLSSAGTLHVWCDQQRGSITVPTNPATKPHAWGSNHQSHGSIFSTFDSMRTLGARVGARKGGAIGGCSGMVCLISDNSL